MAAKTVGRISSNMMQTKDTYQQDYQMARNTNTDIVLTKPPSIAWSKIFSCCRPPPSKVLTVDNLIVKDDEDCNKVNIISMRINHTVVSRYRIQSISQRGETARR